MKILSIDLDFISAPAINDFYKNGMNKEIPDVQPVVQWKQLQSRMPEVFETISQKIDIDNYDFCLRTYFLQSFGKFRSDFQILCDFLRRAHRFS